MNAYYKYITDKEDSFFPVRDNIIVTVFIKMYIGLKQKKQHSNPNNHKYLCLL